MILGVCGFGFSGSGAVLDWLKDHQEVYLADKFEFSFIYKPDGLCDLGNAICYHPVRYFSSDSAIRRFIQYMNRYKKTYNRLTGGQFQTLLEDYLLKVVQIKWIGATSVHNYQAPFFDFIFRQSIPRKLRWHLKKRFNIVIHKSCWPEKEMFFSVLDEENYLKYSKDFVSGIIAALTNCTDSKIVTLDQCFAANDPEESFKYFDEPLAITVVRDPRDNYLLAKKTLGFESSFIPRQHVEDFIVYYKGLMESRRYNAKNERIIEVKYEDLIYNPIDTFANLERKIGLTHVDIDDYKHFRPEVSVNNTQLWRKYTQFESDIELIEKELSDYLYPFEKYNIKPNFLSQSF